ncbi:MAG: hypothetical protein MJ016_02120, partial [Victivallaceae bacterium]|nr:hypothetical protein [Victivallaceae bacterium]
MAAIYYNSSWKDLEPGTTVYDSEGGEHTIGVDAFGVWDDACVAAAETETHEIKMDNGLVADTFYFSPLWEKLADYTVVDLDGVTLFNEYQDGTDAFPLVTKTGGKAVIGINAFASFDAAAAAMDKSGS